MKKNNATSLKLSPRSKVRLFKEEMKQLEEYVNDEPVAYVNIKNNTGIDRRTIVATLERGWMELSAATKLRAFLKQLTALTA